MYGAVPNIGVKLRDPVAEPHCESTTTKSPFTPPLIVISGSFPHLGEISNGFNGQVAPGEAEVQAKKIFEIFKISPQVYVTVL